MALQVEYIGDARDNTDAAPMWKADTQTLSSANFSSPEAFVRWLESAEAQAEKWGDYGKETANADFYGTPSFAVARDLILNGWKDGAAKAEKLRDRINTANPVMRKEVRFSVAGALPDVPRYLAGNPKNMKQMSDARSRKRPVVTLYVQVSASAFVEATSQIRRAAVIAAVIDAIENAGFSCHLVAWHVCYRDTKYSETTVVLKEAGQQADIARLAFGLGHPSFLRRLCFYRMALRKMLSSFGGSLGKPYNGEYTCDQGTYVLSSIGTMGEAKFASDKAAETDGLEAVIAELKQQGCPAFPD